MARRVHLRMGTLRVNTHKNSPAGFLPATLLFFGNEASRQCKGAHNSIFIVYPLIAPGDLTILHCNAYAPSSLPLIHSSLPTVPSPYPNTRHTAVLRLIRTDRTKKRKKLHYSKPSLLLTDQIIPHAHSYVLTSQTFSIFFKTSIVLG